MGTIPALLSGCIVGFTTGTVHISPDQWQWWVFVLMPVATSTYTYYKKP